MIGVDADGGLAVSWEHGQENNMIDTTHKLVPAPADSLHDELRALIASSSQRLARRGAQGYAEAAGFSQWRLRIWGKARNMKRPRP